MAEMAETLTDNTIPLEAPGSAPAPAGVTISPGADWRSGLPEDLRGEKALADFKDVGSLAKSYVETKRLVGDAVRIPKADAKPEELAAFHRKLGVPETPDKYEVKLPDLPAGHPAWSPEKVASARVMAHQLGWTPAQLQGALEWYAKDSIQSRDVSTSAEGKAQQAQQAEAVAALEKEWGPKGGPVWTRQLALARNTVRQLFSDDPKLAELAEMRGNDPVWVKGLARIGEQMLEHGFLEGDAPAEVDKDGLSRQISELRSRMEKVNPGSRQYGELKDSLDRAYQLRYAGGR
jgi:hypothetical protein